MVKTHEKSEDQLTSDTLIIVIDSDVLSCVKAGRLIVPLWCKAASDKGCMLIIGLL